MVFEPDWHNNPWDHIAAGEEPYRPDCRGDFTEREAAMLDRAYAHGMRQGLLMAAQGAENEARAIADRMLADGLSVLCASPSTPRGVE